MPQALPNAQTHAFVRRHAFWISLPALLIAPTAACFTTAICIAIESEFGSRVSDTACAFHLHMHDIDIHNIDMHHT